MFCMCEVAESASDIPGKDILNRRWKPRYFLAKGPGRLPPVRVGKAGLDGKIICLDKRQFPILF